MMTDNKIKLSTIFTSLSTLIIIIGGGHGIMPMLLLQLWSLSDIQNESEEYVICSILFLVGQILIIGSGWSNQKHQKTTFISGVTIVCIGILLLYLISDAGLFTLISSIPFIILAVSTKRKMNDLTTPNEE